MIQLKPGSGAAAAAAAAGGGSFCSQTYLITCMKLKQQHQDAAGEVENSEHGAEVTALHINNTVFEDIMHISSEIFHYPIYPVFI